MANLVPSAYASTSAPLTEMVSAITLFAPEPMPAAPQPPTARMFPPVISIEVSVSAEYFVFVLAYNTPEPIPAPP